MQIQKNEKKFRCTIYGRGTVSLRGTLDGNQNSITLKRKGSNSL